MAPFAKRISATLIMLSSIAACSHADKATPASTSQLSEANYWQRTKDCSARVDAMKDEKNTAGLQYGRIAHYSRKYGRCFAKITTTMDRPSRGNRRDSVMLMDAFEGSIGAMLPFVPPCYLGGKQDDCAKAEAFIEDAMTN